MSISLLILTACNNPTKPLDNATSNSAEIELPAWNKQLSAQASLIKRVTDDVVFYARIPSLWGLLFSPKNDSLNNVLAGSINQQTIATLQQGVKNQLANLPAKISQALKILIYDLRSPLEIAVILPAGSAPTSSQMVIEAQFAFENIDAFNAMLKTVIKKIPQLQLNKEATADAAGLLSIGPVKVFYQFDPATQRFTALTGMAVLASDLQRVIDWTPDNQLAIHTLEKRIDDSGQGFFEWLNFARIKPVIANFIPANSRKALKMTGILSTQYIALGIGVAQGMGNLSIIAQGTDGLIWDQGFSPSKLVNLYTAGKPEYVAGFQLPDGKWLGETIQTIAQLQSPDVIQKQLIDKWIGLDNQVREKIGFSITEILNVLAGKWLTVSDKAGDYTILLPTHPDKLKALLNKLDSNKTFSQQNFKLDDISISELSFTTLSIDIRQKYPILQRFLSRLYFHEENNIFYLAKIPQILVARKQIGSNFSINNWLEKQNIEAQKDFFWLATESTAIPRKNYYLYLQLLQFLGDLVEKPIAIESFPTANKIQLPASGKRGFEFIFAKNEIGFSLNYETHPAEFFMDSNTIVTVAIVGIVAAIAIPAYTNYIKRQSSRH